MLDLDVLGFLSRCGVVQGQCSVISTDQEFVIRRKCERRRPIGLQFQLVQFCHRLARPDLDRTIFSRGREQLPIARIGDLQNGTLMREASV